MRRHANRIARLYEIRKSHLCRRESSKGDVPTCVARAPEVYAFKRRRGKKRLERSRRRRSNNLPQKRTGFCLTGGIGERGGDAPDKRHILLARLHLDAHETLSLHALSMDLDAGFLRPRHGDPISG